MSDCVAAAAIDQANPGPSADPVSRTARGDYRERQPLSLAA
jgi:hypothetical protein